MTSILIVLNYACAVTNMATGSRQLWSFGRDQGVPFHSFFSHVNITLSPHPFQSEKKTLLKNPLPSGPHRPRYPPQRHPRHNRNLHPAHLHQFRLHNRLQPTHSTRDSRASGLLHRLDRVHGLAADPRPGTGTRTLARPVFLARQMGPPRQYPSANVPAPRVRHDLLPAHAGSGPRIHELERRHLLRRAACFGAVLLCGGEEFLYRARRTG